MEALLKRGTRGGSPEKKMAMRLEPLFVFHRLPSAHWALHCAVLVLAFITFLDPTVRTASPACGLLHQDALFTAILPSWRGQLTLLSDQQG